MSRPKGTDGRWMTPDALGGDITSPQSLNRYAYALNQPTTLIDPSGLSPQGDDDCAEHPHKAICGWDASSSAAACMEAGLLPNCSGSMFSGELAAAEAAYLASNCIGCVTFQGTFSGGPYAFANWDQYANWRTSLAAQPESQIYAAYLLGCQYATKPCGSNDQVWVRYVGFTYNVQLDQNPLDPNAASSGGYQDPALFNAVFHPGAPDSYYIGGGYVGVDAGHVVDLPGGIEAHYDSFAPYNPLHWIFEALPSLVINTGGNATPMPYTCSIGEDCHP
jgi:hypothetical protein